MGKINPELLEEVAEVLEKNKEAYMDALDMGVRLEFIIHRNTIPAYKELAERGAIIYYCPEEPPLLFDLNDSHDVIVKERNGAWRLVPNSLYLYVVLNRKYRRMKKKSVQIPLEIIDDVFDMINRAAEPADIVNYVNEYTESGRSNTQ